MSYTNLEKKKKIGFRGILLEKGTIVFFIMRQVLFRKGTFVSSGFYDIYSFSFDREYCVWFTRFVSGGKLINRVRGISSLSSRLIGVARFFIDYSRFWRWWPLKYNKFYYRIYNLKLNALIIIIIIVRKLFRNCIICR